MVFTIVFQDKTQVASIPGPGKMLLCMDIIKNRVSGWIHACVHTRACMRAYTHTHTKEGKTAGGKINNEILHMKLSFHKYPL
jgi:hypothetical protein